jgi:predicted nucleic-acid-binding protein
MNLAGSVDTNILVRLVTQDDARQAKAVDRLMTRCAQDGQLLFVPATVVLELEWVLRTQAGLGNAQFAQTMNALLSMVELGFESEQALEQALADYQEGSADFAECLHVALGRAQAALPFWTFDRKAAKVVGAELLPHA